MPAPAAVTPIVPRPLRVECGAVEVEGHHLEDVVLGGWTYGPPLGSAPVVVGSKNFTEQVLLGEIVGAQLESRGFVVDRRLNLGGTALCHEAVRSGQLHPELANGALHGPLIEIDALHDLEAKATEGLR